MTIFKSDENGRQFFKWVENTLGKGEIAHNEQFLLFPQCFQKTCTADTKEQGLFWKGLKSGWLGKQLKDLLSKCGCIIMMFFNQRHSMAYNAPDTQAKRIQFWFSRYFASTSKKVEHLYHITYYTLLIIGQSGRTAN